MIKAYLDFDAGREYPETEHEFVMIPQIPNIGTTMSFRNSDNEDHTDWKLMYIDYYFDNGVFESVRLYLQDWDVLIQEKNKLKEKMDMVTLQLKQYDRI